MSQNGQLDKRLRNLRKKLAEIATLEEKHAGGQVELSDAQYEKLQRRDELEEELRQLEDPLDSAPPPQQASVAAAPLAIEVPAAAPHLNGRCPASLSHHFEDAMKSPSMRWEEDPVSVEDVMPMPALQLTSAGVDVETIEAVQPFSPAVQSSEKMQALVKAVSRLSLAAFDEDALHMVTRKSGWKLTLLACPEPAAEHPLIGFLVYRLRPELQSLSVAKLAIVPEHRRRGHGCRLIDWCVRTAKKQPTISFISLSSLPEAVKFYQRLGFRKYDVGFGQREPEEDLVEGQVYMEKPVKGRGKTGKAGSRR